MDACIHICILLFCVIRRLWRWFLMCEARQEPSMACYKIRVKKQIEYGKIFLYYILYFMGKIKLYEEGEKLCRETNRMVLIRVTRTI